MSDALARVLGYTLLPVLSAVLGAGVATFHPPGSRMRSYIQHFAAGVVFAVVAVELLPDVVREHQPIPTVIGFTLGTGVMLGIRWLMRRFAGDEAPAASEQIPAGLLAGVGVDLLIDGLLLGIGFAAGVKEGRLLAFALAAEMLSLGVATAAALGRAGQSRGKSLGIVGALAMLLVAGAVAGTALLSATSHTTLEIVLSFGLAALLFLVTEELLVEAHEEPETPLATATFFLGFQIFLVLGMIH